MELKKARSRYWAQRSSAKLRGIEWHFTFKTWLEWWGDDLDKRGSGTGNLQMQRFADSGPYAPWNVRKGTPRQNSKTATAVRLNKTYQRLAQELEAARDADPGIDLPPDEMTEDEQWLHENVGWGAKQYLYDPRYD